MGSCASISTALVAALAVVAMRSSLEPVVYEVPALPVLEANDALVGNKVRRIGEGDLVGPESLAKLGDDVLFAGLADGRIVRVTEKEGNFTATTVVRTGEEHAKCGRGGPADTTHTEAICGRPLGLRIVKKHSVLGGEENEDVLLVADPYKGLLMVTGLAPTETAKLTTLATSCGPEPLGLINDVVQHADGTIYLTETSQRFQRRRIFHAVLEGRKEGRIFAIRASQRAGQPHVECRVLVDNLHMANGITLTHDGSKLLVVTGVTLQEVDPTTGAIRQLRPTETGALPGTGDNVRTFRTTPRGEVRNCYWGGLGSKYAEPFSLIAAVARLPVLRRLVGALLPYGALVELIPKHGIFVVFDEKGAILETYQDPTGQTPWISEVEDLGDYLVLGSWYNPYLAVVRKDAL